MGFAREVADQLVFMDGGVVVEAGNPRSCWPTRGRSGPGLSCRSCCEDQAGLRVTKMAVPGNN